jgi:DNA-binding GntR family transcriptional regulator
MGEGLIEVVARRGTFVTRIDANRLWEICEIRRMMETYAAAQGVERVGHDQLDRMRALIEGSERLFRGRDRFSYSRYASMNTGFHTLIVEWSGNQKLLELYSNLFAFIQIARVRYLQEVEPRVRAHEEHKLIFKAYEERDSATLLELIDQHISSLETELLELARAAEHSP